MGTINVNGFTDQLVQKLANLKRRIVAGFTDDELVQKLMSLLPHLWVEHFSCL